MGIAGKRPARRSELSEPGRLRWLQRQMRAVTVRSIARLWQAVDATTAGGFEIVALPFIVAGEPDRDAKVRLRARYSATDPIRPLLLVSDALGGLTPLPPPDDIVAGGDLPPRLTWLDPWDGARRTSPWIAVPAQSAVRMAIGFENKTGARNAFVRAEIVQLDEEDREMGRVLWIA